MIKIIAIWSLKLKVEITLAPNLADMGLAAKEQISPATYVAKGMIAIFN